MWITGCIIFCLCTTVVQSKPRHHVKSNTHKRTFDDVDYFKGDSQRKDGGGLAPEPHITSEDSLDDMPNTAGPNPNIFGGFPENDVWGNFELPNPDTIDHLKLALKMSHHRPSYAGDQASDANDQLYSYEHHALPEYDIMETPPFQEALWQNAQLQELLKAGRKPGCPPGMGSCPPVNNPHVCQHLNHMCGGVNAHHPQHPKLELAPPCASKILALFGCGPPAPAPPPPPPPAPPPPPHPEPQHLLPIPVKKPKEEDKDKPKEDDKKEDKPKKEQEKDGEKKENYPLADLIEDEEKSSSDIMAGETKSELHKKMKEAKSTEGGKVRLMNEEQSLALMSAIGSDLEKSLQGKLVDGGNAKAKTNVLMKNESSGVEVDLGSGKEPPEAGKQKATVDNEHETDSVGQGKNNFSDWSDWTTCERRDKLCGRGTKTRRRICMSNNDDDCEDVMQETSACKIATKCEEPSTASEKPTEESSSAEAPSKQPTNAAQVPDEHVANATTESTASELIASNEFKNILEDKAKHVLGMYGSKRNSSLVEEDGNSKSEEQSGLGVVSIASQHIPLKRWGNWTRCDAECGVGKISRDFMCDDVTCEGSEKNRQVRSCRIKPCLDSGAENSLKDVCMSHENNFRQRHGAEPLQWSNDLYRKAIEITDHMALNAVSAQNLPQYERPGLLLAYVSPSSANVDDISGSCRNAIEKWYNQKQSYNFKEPSMTEADRDFIQLVWKSSRLVGISRSRLPDGGSYIASIFQPVGDLKSMKGSKKDLLVKVAKKNKLSALIERIFNKKRT